LPHDLEMKALIDRAGFVAGSNADVLAQNRRRGRGQQARRRHKRLGLDQPHVPDVADDRARIKRTGISASVVEKERL